MTINQRFVYVATAACIALMLGSAPAHAQKESAKSTKNSSPGGFLFTPFVALSSAYNDNIFVTSTNLEGSTILRLNPGFGMTYHSRRTDFNLNYSLAADKYTQYPDLNSWHDEQRALFGIKHQFTNRFSAGIGASYFETHNPGALTPQAGLVLARSRSTLVGLEPSFSYDLSKTTSMNVFYNRTRYTLVGGQYTDTGTASAALTHTLNPRDSLKFQFQNTAYKFSNSGSPTSNVVTLGWTHAFSRRTTLDLSAGPRVTGGSVAPELLARFRYNSNNLSYSLAYNRSQAAVIGASGPINAQGLQLAVAYAPTRRIGIGIAPSYYHDYGSGLSANIYRADFFTRYFFSPAWSLGLTYSYSLQHGQPASTTNNAALKVNIVTLALTWALPPPDGRYPNPTLPREGVLLPAQ